MKELVIISRKGGTFKTSIDASFAVLTNGVECESLDTNSFKVTEQIRSFV